MSTQPYPEAPTRPLDRNRRALRELPVIPGYELLGEIGRGGMGVVHRARQIDLDRIVAIKIVSTANVTTSAERMALLREARAAAALDHPNVVKVHDVIHAEGYACFSMELIEGESLAELLGREGPLSSERAAHLAHDVARAVTHAHLHGIVHRDLKPSNVLLGTDGRVRITDFGIAGFERDRPAEGTVADDVSGTPGFMSPEQVLGSPDAHAATVDVHGLGALLHALLTARPPYEGETPSDVLLAVLQRPPSRPRELLRSIPRDLDAIVMRCLAKEPRARYPTPQAVAEELERFLAGEPVLAKGGKRANLLAWLLRRPLAVTAFAALALFTLNYEISRRVDPDPDTAQYDLWVHSLVPSWIGATIVFQELLLRVRRSRPVLALWSMSDAGFLTALIWAADGPSSPLVIALPLLITATALRMRTWLVWLATGCSLIGYSLIWVHASLERPDVAARPKHLICMLAALAVAGVMSAMLVRQQRRLTLVDRY